jgi:hypothetical protein
LNCYRNIHTWWREGVFSDVRTDLLRFLFFVFGNDDATEHCGARGWGGCVKLWGGPLFTLCKRVGDRGVGLCQKWLSAVLAYFLITRHPASSSSTSDPANENGGEGGGVDDIGWGGERGATTAADLLGRIVRHMGPAFPTGRHRSPRQTNAPPAHGGATVTIHSRSDPIPRGENTFPIGSYLPGTAQL